MKNLFLTALIFLGACLSRGHSIPVKSRILNEVILLFELGPHPTLLRDSPDCQEVTYENFQEVIFGATFNSVQDKHPTLVPISPG